MATNSERYDDISAKHYAAFRPPLHSLILNRLLGSDETFEMGLDIGCGTGYSALALTKYCERVIGLDSSPSMLADAKSHNQITYVCGQGDDFQQLPAQRFDVVTFAGSLYYTKTERLRKELARVCNPQGTILVYDFELLLHGFMAKFGVEVPSTSSDYDHGANLKEWTEFSIVKDSVERLGLEVSEKDLTHLLLSDSNRYDVLSKSFPKGDLFESLVDELMSRSIERDKLFADIYFARYLFQG